MDNSTLAHVIENMIPVFAMLALSAIPLGIVFMSKYFKLKTRELELEAALHGQAIDGQLRTLEGRLAANEAAVTSLVNVLTAQRSLLEAPPVPADKAEAQPQPLQLARQGRGDSGG